MRIAVTGAGGLLGSAVTRTAGERGHLVVPLERAQLDVTDRAAVRSALALSEPEAVVHCAAYTAVDGAESEAEAARKINVGGTRNTAEASSAAGARFAYISTDYVFAGSKRAPYRTDDPTGPLSTYGATKLEGELAAREAAPGALIVRTSWLYGDDAGFVPAILRRAAAGEALRVVDDQRGRPTWAENAARGIVELLELGATGVYHVADGGDCTWIELAREALARTGLDVPVEAVSSDEYGAAARRPAYSVLDLAATEEALGRAPMHWRDALGRYLAADAGTPLG